MSFHTFSYYSFSHVVICSESLYESEELSKEAHDAAALLASKVYYFLGEYDEALSFALSAGVAFEAESHTPGSEEYRETVICECKFIPLAIAVLIPSRSKGH